MRLRLIRWLLAFSLVIGLAAAVEARLGGKPGVSLSGLSLSNSTFVGSTPGGPVGILSATVSDGSTPTWTLKGANSGGFVVNANTGAVTQALGGTACGTYSDLRAEAKSSTAVNSAQYIPLTLVSGPCISAINLSNSTFPIPSTDPLATLSATCSFGSCAGVQFFLAVQAGCTSNDDAAFVIPGGTNNVNAVTQINDTTQRAFCVEAILNGAPNFFQSFTLTGGSGGGSVISSINLSTSTFPEPSSNPLSTLSVTCSSGPCSGVTFQLATQAGCTSTNNSAFTISGINVNAVSQISDTTARTFCVEASISGSPNFFQSLTLTGVSSGSVPAMAAGAGFNTLVLSSDFSQPKYAVQSNWLNCNGTGAFSIPNPEWHRGWLGFGDALAGPCSAFTQQIDGANGPALQIHWDDAYCTVNGVFKCYQAGVVFAASSEIQTTNSEGNGTIIPPNAYYEVVARWVSVDHTWADFWSYTIDPVGIEWDGMEVVSFNNDSGTREHNNEAGTVRELPATTPDGCCSTTPTSPTNLHPNGIDVSQYHKYSWRVTSDGRTNGYWCAAIDDVAWNCDTWTPTAKQLAGENTIMQLSAQSNSGQTGLIFDVWVKSVKIYSCAPANSGAKCYSSVPNPNPPCAGC